MRIRSVAPAPAAPPQAAKMSHYDFAVKAVTKLRGEKYKGIHTVYSGFNAAFKEYFPGEDPVAAVKALEAANKIQTHFARGGVMLYIYGEMPERAAAGGTKALSAILGA